MYLTSQKPGRCWPRRRPGAPRAGTLSVFALAFLFSFFLLNYILLTAFCGRLGQFRPAAGWVDVNLALQGRSRPLPFAKICKHRVPTCLIEASSPHLLHSALASHQQSVGNARKSELGISSVGRIGQHIRKRYAVLCAVISGDFDRITADPQHADAFLFECAYQPYPAVLICLASRTAWRKSYDEEL